MPIDLDRPRTLRFDLNAFCAFETTVGKSIETVWGSFDRQPFTSIRALLWAGLLHEEPELTLEEAGRLITPADLYKAGSAIGQALGAAFGEDRAQAPFGTPERSHNERVHTEPTDWLSLWAFGRFDIGLGEAEFWRQTWGQLKALGDRYAARCEREDYQAGLAAMMLFNINRAKSQEPMEPLDFFRPRPERRQTPEEQLGLVRMMNAAFGGTESRKETIVVG